MPVVSRVKQEVVVAVETDHGACRHTYRLIDDPSRLHMYYCPKCGIGSPLLVLGQYMAADFQVAG